MPLFAWFNTFLVSVGADNRYFDPIAAGFFLDQWIMDTQPALGGEKTLATVVFELVPTDGSITYRTVMSMRVIHTPIR
jgi:hypothetical protein